MGVVKVSKRGRVPDARRVGNLPHYVMSETGDDLLDGFEGVGDTSLSSLPSIVSEVPRDVLRLDGSSDKARNYLRDIGIEGDVQACLDIIRRSTNRNEILGAKLRLESLHKAVAIYKAAGETAYKQTSIESIEGGDKDDRFGEVSLNLVR